MLKNYFVTAWRSLVKNRIYSVINVTGLAVGITAVLCILVYVNDELSYDRYHPKSDRIFRIIQEGKGEHSASLPFMAGPAIQNDYPELVEAFVRLFNEQASTIPVAYEDVANPKVFNEPRFFYADSTFFKVFHYDFIDGDPESCLDGPNQIVLTKTAAARYFSGSNPIGKTLKIEGNQEFTVTGVVEDVPPNSHFKFDFIASFRSLLAQFPGNVLPQRWYWNPVWTYVLLKKPEDAATLQKQMPFLVKKYYEPGLAWQTELTVQPLTNIYLHSTSESEIGVMGNIKFIYIFSLVAIAILLIACVNFINLTTARSAERFKEIGVRKVMGAYRKHLMLQFITESMVVTMVSAVIAILLTLILLPLMGTFAGKELSALNLLNTKTLIAFGVVILLVGLVAGSYPAFVLSVQNEIKVLKSKGAGNSGNSLLRSALVVLQFVMCVILISGTIAIYRQLAFMKEADLGFNKDHIIGIPIQRTDIAMNFTSFKKALLLNSNIKEITGCHAVVGKESQTSNYKRQGQDDMITYPILVVRDDFLETMKIDLIEGRSFREEYTDTTYKAIINLKMMKALGWSKPEEAVGQVIDAELEGKTTIVGVCEDFHYASLKDDIGPLLLMRPKPNSRQEQRMTNFLYARVSPKNLDSSLKFMEQTWNKFTNNVAFQFFFLNDKLGQIYSKEETFANVIVTFSLLAIGLGIMGMFGLTAFSVQKRKKEISIRKVIGASLGSVFVLLSSDFLKLVIIAGMVGVPLSISLVYLWLSGFAFHIPIQPLGFVASVAIVIITTLLTISYQVYKAAVENPVNSLRSE